MEARSCFLAGFRPRTECGAGLSRVRVPVSPLQYQKQLRLQRARERMLMDGMDATSAAYEVGYESVSQFNREYSRFFGQPPMRDIKTLRASGVVAA
jgi:AraC-like DNA-binding protein